MPHREYRIGQSLMVVKTVSYNNQMFKEYILLWGLDDVALVKVLRERLKPVTSELFTHTFFNNRPNVL